MRVNWLATASLVIAAALGLPLVSSAQSQTYTIADYTQPPTPGPDPDAKPVKPMAPTPMASAPVKPLVQPQVAATAEPEEEEEETCDPWRLFCQKECGWNFTGYIDAGGTWNPQNPADRFNGPVTWLDRANDVQLTEIWMNYQKDTEYGTCDWQVGGRVTALWGSNYRWDTSAGFESQWGNGQFYGLAMPNAYAEVTKGNFKTKVGRFVSPVGFYTVGIGNNFFNLIPYTYQYGEPFTHTGVYTTYQANEDLEVGGAIINGWDSTANWDPTGTRLAAAVPGITDPWNRNVGGLVSVVKKNIFFCDDSDSFAYVGVFSKEPDITLALRTNRYLQTLVYSRQINPCLQYVIQSDFGTQTDALGPGLSAQWFGVNQYLYWKQNDCWKWGANFEWFRDDDGFRVGTVLPSFGSPNARGFVGGPFEGDFFRLMVGPNWTPTANWTIRPTLVYDWYSGPGAGGLQPYNAGASPSQFLINLDAYFVF